MKTENKSLYRFEDFTISHYRELIQLCKATHEFSFFHDVKINKPSVLWRHDIDFSAQRALKCAQVEVEEGVKSTYFVHLHSEYYNFFEKEIYNKIAAIAEMGHEIGVHFDIHFYGITTEEEIEAKLLFEKEILEKTLGIDIKSFSFHVINDFIKTCKKHTYAGLVNAYADFFQNNFIYCSDSNGYWRYERMQNVIEKNKNNSLQLLTHPEWWQEDVMSPFDKIKRCINGRAESNIEGYIKLLEEYNAKNIDW